MRHIISTTRRLTKQKRFGFSELAKFQNNFLATTNVAYIQSLYEKWQKDKSSISPSFAAYFELLQSGQDPQTAYQKPPQRGETLSISSSNSETIKQLGVRMMIDRYRAVGHQFAKLDPLEMHNQRKLHGRLDPSILNLSEFGFSQNDRQKQIILKYLRQQNSDKINGPYTIDAMEKYLKQTYLGKVGYEYWHLTSKEERDFLKVLIQNQIQTLTTKQPTKQDRVQTFKRLCKDQCFIDFLILKFSNFKRFGIQGLNSVTSAMGKLVEVAAGNKTEHIVFGMAHRGRLNALHCVFGKPAQQIFRQFLQKDSDEPDTQTLSSGDVKYHLGYLTKTKIKDNEVYLQILPNPSHLQAVDPLVYGTTRAVQQHLKDKNKQKVFGVLIHGDAAVSGQGIVYQSIQMQDLVDYSTGGIIHIVMNNQVGFTTNPHQSRSSYYCTQIAKVVDAPVIHVNADEPDLLDGCMRVAVDYRQKFKKDIFIDIVGYRRFGHNQQDQPFFTQPKMYEKIKNHPSVYELYEKKCIQTGALTKQQIDQIKQDFMKQYEQDYKKVQSDTHDKVKEIEDPIYNILPIKNPQHKTGVKKQQLAQIFKNITKWPENFNVHPTIKKIFEERIKNFTTNDNLDWATMQSLAFGSLLKQGYGVRLSGQDVERGTFSHRHACISDQQRDVQKFCLFKQIGGDNVAICNSHLSQYGVLGFQYGHSITNPNNLVIWEAQFGDFANGASTIIDNYLISGQSKWGIQSGLVLSLPHGMDGQGPQHSSARIQRFLHLSDDNCDIDQKMKYQDQLSNCNIQVVCCSTTSNYFHSLRRQLKRDYRKPLINFNSKRLLKFKGANRPATDIIQGTQFTPVYGDEEVDAAKVKRVILCHGQFYYDLKTKRDQLKLQDTAIVRIEQLAPFPHQHLKKALSKFNSNVEIQWVQQDHENYGPWNFLHPRLKKLFGRQIKYFGRKPSGATAGGALKLHKIQEAKVMGDVFKV